MRAVLCALVVSSLAACGGPALQNVPKPNPTAVAGAAAAAAAAATLVDPNAATRGKPEHPEDQQQKAPIEVKEHVTSDVLDRLDRLDQLDHAEASGAGSGATAKPGAAARPAHETPAHRHALKLPSPEQAAEHTQPAQPATPGAE